MLHHPRRRQPRRHPRAIAVAVVLTLLGGACSSSSGPERLVVSAASSLAAAFEEMASAYEVDHPDVQVDLNIAGSTRLREQIIEGAPVDVFASANLDAMADVASVVDLAGLPQVFAANSLVIGVPAGNPGGVVSVADFEIDGLLLGVCVETVPCGAYAADVFELAGVEPAIDSKEPDAGALVLKLELGELDAGIVYRTDVSPSNTRLSAILIPDEHNVVAAYPIVAVSHAEHAADFVAFVLSERGRGILASHGFELP